MDELAGIATHDTLGLLQKEQHKTIIVYSDNGSRLSRCINVTLTRGIVAIALIRFVRR